LYQAVLEPDYFAKPFKKEENMKKVILLLLVVGFFVSQSGIGYAQDMEKTVIRFGMSRKTVAKQCGEPLLVEKIKTFPVPRRKALYDLGDSDYAVIYFSFWVVQKVIFLEGISLDEARETFKQG